MSGTGASNLRVNNRGIDTPFYGDLDVSRPKGWFAAINDVHETFEVFPNNQQQGTPGGGFVNFELDYKGDTLNKMYLYFRRTALQGKGTFIRPVDWEAIQCIDVVEFQYGNRTLYTITGKELLPRILQEKDLASRTALAQLLGGNLSDAERTARAGDQHYVWELPVPWGEAQKPLIMSALPQKILCRVRFHPCEKWTQSDAVGATCSFDEMHLTLHYTHFEDSKKKERFNLPRSTSGLQYKVSTLESHHDVLVPTGTRRFRYQLKNLKNNIYNIRVTLNRKVDRDGPNAHPDNWQLCDRLRLQDGGTDVINTVDVKTTGVYITNPLMYPEGAVGINVMNIPLCRPEYVQHSRDDCYGGRTMSKYGNPELLLEWDTPTTEELYLDIDGECHNILLQVMGDLRITYL